MISRSARINIGSSQLELHAYNPQHKLLEFLKSKGIVPQAYSPLGSTGSPLLADDHVAEIAEKHSLTPSDVLLGYLGMSCYRGHEILLCSPNRHPCSHKGLCRPS